MNLLDSGAVVEDVLERYAAITRREMERYLPAAGALDAGLAELIRDYPRRAGKGIRPALVLASCQAFGGAADEALGPAIAIELLHNAFLIHDDIEDESKLRRGRPTLHELHGIPLALNAGDTLAVLGLGALNIRGDLGARLSQVVLDEVVEMTRHTTAGQNLELRWRRDNRLDLQPEDYLQLILRKTCCYTTIYPLRIGAIVGSRGSVDTATLEALSQFGYYLGAAFQIRDDLLNLVGSPERYGKEPLGDLHEGKRTLMLISLVSRASGADRAWVRDYLGRPIEDRTADETEQVLALMERYDCLAFAATWGHAIATAAHRAFAGAFAGVRPTVHTEFLEAMIAYMLVRPR